VNILLYHWGYYGDIIVVGQNFAKELKGRYPGCKIDLMVRPRIKNIKDILHSLNLFQSFIEGEKEDYNSLKSDYDKHYLIDDRVYPEGHLRTIFTHSGFNFRQHPLKLIFNNEQLRIASEIVSPHNRPVITSQDDMARKWSSVKSANLQKKISGRFKLILVGPNQIHPEVGRKLTFMESCAVISLSDLFFGIDSGIAHGAALSGTQTILIPPIHPEYFISPTSYGNQFIADPNLHHISIKPDPADFCGNYLCLKSNRKGQLSKPSGTPKEVRCNWKKKYFLFPSNSCYNEISTEYFYNIILKTLKNRNLLN
jgi:ADP-heptose:LPS heptosyltransferase